MIKASNVMDYVNAGKYKDQIDLIINFTKTEVIIIADIVLITPCRSIQLAINPGIIFPITS